MSGDSTADEDGEKRALRGVIRGRVRAIKQFAREQRARRLAATVLRSPPLSGAQLVLAYRAMGDEISVDEIVRALAERGVRVAFPSVGEGGSMRLLEIVAANPLASGHWTTDRFGIAAPDPESTSARVVFARELDAVIVPGRAFDARGARLGRGKGFYDALLGRLRPDGRRATIGVCFREQLVDSVVEGPQDRRVAFVAAEGRLIRGVRKDRGEPRR